MEREFGMSRNFDTWNRYLDNNNKPLHGCVMFNVKDGNTAANIYDSDNTPLSNPIITDMAGRTLHQVFVDSDVIAYFYKYIGTGEFNTGLDIDINDDSKWTLQFTVESVNDILAHISTDSVICIENMAALRALDVSTVPVINGTKVITLLGYDSIGDKEPVNYIWNPSLTDNDDNGAVIQGPNLTGRWVMVKPVEHLDCRHYGIFPQNTTNFEGNTARMNQWITYCNSVNVRPYFSAHGDYRYYKYNNLSFTTEAVDIASEVIFLDYGTSCIWNTEFNGNPYFYNHVTRLNSDYVKTSWGAYGFVNPKHVIIDNEDNTFTNIYSDCIVDIDIPVSKAFSFTGCTVNINKTFSGVSQFVNCIINSKEQISSGCYFTNCKLSEDMFFGSPNIHVDTNCIADMDDFLNKQHMWLLIKEQQQQVNYDWKGTLTTENPWEGVIETDRWLINYKGINPEAVLKEGDNAHTYYIENCAGALTLEGKNVNTYIIKGSELTLTFGNNFNPGSSIIAYDSTIIVNAPRIGLDHLSCSNVTFGGSGSFDVNYLTANNCMLSIPMYAAYMDIKNSNIQNTVQVYGLEQDSPIIVDTDPSSTDPHPTYSVTRVISANFIDNYVNGQIMIGHADAFDPHYTLYNLVRGLTITGNLGISSTPVVVKRTDSSKYDNYNIYTYRNNTGTMKMESTGNANVYQGANYWPANQYAGFICGIYNSTFYAWTLFDEDPATYANAYAYEVRLFTIGIYNVSVEVSTYIHRPSGVNKISNFTVGGSNFILQTGKPTAATMQLEQMIKLGTDQFAWGVKFSPFGSSYVEGALQSTPAQLAYKVTQL